MKPRPENDSWRPANGELPPRIWADEQHRELHEITRNGYGDLRFMLDGGEVFQFTPREDVDIPPGERVHVLGWFRNDKTKEKIPQAVLVLKDPKEVHNGNLRVFPTTPLTASAGVVLIDGHSHRITSRDWREDSTPHLLTKDGKELPPSTQERWLGRFEVTAEDGQRFSLHTQPHFRSQAQRLTPVSIERIEPQQMRGGLTGHETILQNAIVKFAEQDKAERCFVDIKRIDGPKAATIATEPPKPAPAVQVDPRETKPEPEDGADMLTTQEAALFANVSTKTIQTWTAKLDHKDEPMLPGARLVAGKWLIPRGDLKPFVKPERRRTESPKTTKKATRKKHVKQ